VTGLSVGNVVLSCCRKVDSSREQLGTAPGQVNSIQSETFRVSGNRWQTVIPHGRGVTELLRSRRRRARARQEAREVSGDRHRRTAAIRANRPRAAPRPYCRLGDWCSTRGTVGIRARCAAELVDPAHIVYDLTERDRRAGIILNPDRVHDRCGVRPTGRTHPLRHDHIPRRRRDRRRRRIGRRGRVSRGRRIGGRRRR
jgi:hypothetical protein